MSTAIAGTATHPASETTKLKLLVGLLRKRPTEALDRVRTALESRWDRRGLRTELQPGGAGGVLQEQLLALREEKACARIEQGVRERARDLRASAAFDTIHNAVFPLAELCYGVVRCRKPSVVVETGVAFGVTTAFRLAAMAENGSGTLYSVDLPPLAAGADAQVGILVPLELRSRWKLVRGSCRRMLPRVFEEVGTIDVFVHDSLHTYGHMTWEYEQAWQRLSSKGFLISDDIAFNDAFEAFRKRHRVAMSFVRRDDNGTHGWMQKP